MMKKILFTSGLLLVNGLLFANPKLNPLDENSKFDIYDNDEEFYDEDFYEFEDDDDFDDANFENGFAFTDEEADLYLLESTRAFNEFTLPGSEDEKSNPRIDLIEGNWKIEADLNALDKKSVLVEKVNSETLSIQIRGLGEAADTYEILVPTSSAIDSIESVVDGNTLRVSAPYKTTGVVPVHYTNNADEL